MPHTVIVGAGPAGLTAAYELARLGLGGEILEQDSVVGGLARTASYRGFRFDIGGHRFFTKVEEVRRIWDDLLGADLLLRPRLSRIYYRETFFDYPLKPANALLGLGPAEAMRIGASFAAAQLFPSAEERTFEQWVVNRFGRRLFQVFFQSYTEKVWGMPCSEIGSEWAAQRIKNLDLSAAVRNAFLGHGRGGLVTTLIEQFHYPRLGPGMMWERCRDRVAGAGIGTAVDARVVRVAHDGSRVSALVVVDAAGRERRVSGDHFIVSMPLRDLVLALDPPPPPAVLAAARRLRYRDFLTVVLITRRAEPFPDNWIYIHEPRVRVGRIQNFRAWSPEMVPDPDAGSLGLEYFVQEGDELWSAADPELVALGAAECEALGLLDPSLVTDGTVVRMPKAYPVYDSGYREALAELRGALARLGNLQVIGRNGQHRYNNQDHSMVTGLLAARNVAGAKHDVWAVNVEADYHEHERPPDAGGGRRTPEAPRGLDAEALMREVFARFDAVAMGGAVATVAGAGLFLAAAVLLVRGGDVIGPRLALLGQFLPGFRVTWSGALLGAAEAAVAGFGFGWLLAKIVNLLVGIEERLLQRRLELVRALDTTGGEA